MHVSLKGATHLTTLDVFALGATEQSSNVISGHTVIKKLLEHFNSSAGSFQIHVHANDLQIITDIDTSLLHSTSNDGSTTSDREDILNGHEEGLVQITSGLGDILVNGSHELEDGIAAELLVSSLRGGQGRATDDGRVIAIEVIEIEQLADLHLDQLQKLFVIDHVALVQENNKIGNANLLGEEDVLPRLGHRSIGGGNDKDTSVHLGGASNHILHVIGVTGAIDVAVVSVFGLVFDVAGIDSNLTGLLLGGLVNVLVAHGLGPTLLGKDVGNGLGESRLSMIDVTDGTNVDVRLGSVVGVGRHGTGGREASGKSPKRKTSSRSSRRSLQQWENIEKKTKMRNTRTLLYFFDIPGKVQANNSKSTQMLTQTQSLRIVSLRII